MKETVAGSVTAMIHTLLLTLHSDSRKLSCPHLIPLTSQCPVSQGVCTLFSPKTQTHSAVGYTFLPAHMWFRRPGHAPVTVFVCSVRSVVIYSSTDDCLSSCLSVCCAFSLFWTNKCAVEKNLLPGFC